MALLKKYQKGETFLNPYGFQEEEFEWKEAPVKTKTSSEKTSEKQKLFNENFKVNKPSNYDILKQKAAADLKELEKFAEEKGIKLTEKDKENSLNSFWRIYGNTLSLKDLAYIDMWDKNHGTISQGKEYTWADKAGNIIRNPLVATAYFLKPGPFNMPMNYSAMERSPGFSDPVFDNNLVLKGLSAASYLHPATALINAGNDALYTEEDIKKAIKSGKAEDWKNALTSAGFTALDFVPGTKLIGRSGRLLNTGESAALEAMRLSRSPKLNNIIGNKIIPSISSTPTSVANDFRAVLVPQLNPASIKYNPIVRKAYNKAVVGAKAQDVGQAYSALYTHNPKINAGVVGSKAQNGLQGLDKANKNSFYSIYAHDYKRNKNMGVAKIRENLEVPYNKNKNKSLQQEYIERELDYLESPEFNRIMDQYYPNVDKQKYKETVIGNLKASILEFNPDKVPSNAVGVYNTMNSLPINIFARNLDFTGRVKYADYNKSRFDKEGSSFVSNPSATFHELRHQSTNGNDLLPDWLTNELLIRNAKKAPTTYLSKPTEFDVRIKQLKEDIKSSGIKDYYKESLTPDDIRKLPYVKVQEEADLLHKKFNIDYRRAKKEGDINKIKEIKENYLSKSNELTKKGYEASLSTDTEDLLEYWSPEFLSFMANKLPATIIGTGIAGSLLYNPWNKKQ